MEHREANRPAVPSRGVREAVFRVDHVTKVYPMGEVEVHALRGVDVELHQSELTVLLGPSGNGKSTLLNILGGLDVPSSGQVHYRDQELTAATESELTRYRRQHVGFVFQFSEAEHEPPWGAESWPRKPDC